METNSPGQPNEGKRHTYMLLDRKGFVDKSTAVVLYKQDTPESDLYADRFKISFDKGDGSGDKYTYLYDMSKMDENLKDNIMLHLGQKKAFCLDDLFSFDVYFPKKSMLSKSIKTKKGTEIFFTYAKDSETDDYLLDRIRITKEKDGTKDSEVYNYKTAKKEIIRNPTGIEERLLDGSNLVLHYRLSPETNSYVIDKLTTRTDKPANDHIYEYSEPEELSGTQKHKKITWSEAKEELGEMAKMGYIQPVEIKTDNNMTFATYAHRDKTIFYEKELPASKEPSEQKPKGKVWLRAIEKIKEKAKKIMGFDNGEKTRDEPQPYNVNEKVNEETQKESVYDDSVYGDTLTEVLDSAKVIEQAYEKPVLQDYEIPKKSKKLVSNYTLKGVPMAISAKTAQNPQNTLGKAIMSEVKGGQTIELISMNNKKYSAVTGKEFNNIGKQVRRVYDFDSMPKCLQNEFLETLNKGIMPENSIFGDYVVEEAKFTKIHVDYDPKEYLILSTFAPVEDKKIEYEKFKIELLNNAKENLEDLLEQTKDYKKLKKICKNADKPTLFKLIRLVDEQEGKITPRDLIQKIEPKDYKEETPSMKEMFERKLVYNTLIDKLEPMYAIDKPEQGMLQKVMYKPVAKLLKKSDKISNLWNRITGYETEKEKIQSVIDYADTRIARIKKNIKHLGMRGYEKIEKWCKRHKVPEDCSELKPVVKKVIKKKALNPKTEPPKKMIETEPSTGLTERKQFFYQLP